MEAILELYRRTYNPQHPVVCFDEASHQLLAHVSEPLAARVGQLGKQDYEYQRCGTRNVVLIEIFGKKEADRIAQRIRFHYTPPHGSWLNMAEIEIGIMRHQCLRRRIPDEWTLGTELMAWELQVNQACRKIHWSFTVDDARKVFANHYPSKLEI